jgi:small-conductance mechanosensitive channel
VVFKLLAAHLLRLAGPVMAMVEPLVFVLIVLTVTWLLSRTIDFASARLTDRYEGEDHAGNAHEMLTRIKVAKHFFTVVVLLAGLGVAFWQFEWFQAMGYSLLASAGIAALVLGLAAQRPLGNLFAGVQLALTQPVRVGDAVIFNGEWGWIEEIAVTYVVIRTWDMRRLVVPTSQLMDNAVENWTKGGENMMKPVYLYADYRVNFAAVRDELERVLQGSDDWDEEVPPILQVTNCTEETVELRALCSAKDPSVAWNLHCQVREQLIAFLRDLDDGAYLPRTRIAMVGEDRVRPPESPEVSQGSGRRNKGQGRPARSDRRRDRGQGKSRKKAHARESKAADQNRMGGGARNDGQAEGGDGQTNR